MNCPLCNLPFPTMLTENPDLPVQAVFTVKNGQRLHVACPTNPDETPTPDPLRMGPAEEDGS